MKIAKYRVGEVVIMGELTGNVVECRIEEGLFLYSVEYDEERPFIENIPESYLIEEEKREIGLSLKDIKNGD